MRIFDKSNKLNTLNVKISLVPGWWRFRDGRQDGAHRRRRPHRSGRQISESSDFCASWTVMAVAKRRGPRTEAMPSAVGVPWRGAT